MHTFLRAVPAALALVAIAAPAVASPAQPSVNGTITGRVWEDSDHDGIQDAGEGGLSGFTITMTAPTAAGPVITYTATTGTNGVYRKTIPPARYTVRTEVFNTTRYLLSSQDQGADDAVDSDFRLVVVAMSATKGKDVIGETEVELGSGLTEDRDAGLVPAP